MHPQHRIRIGIPAAFTLVEAMIASGISLLVIAGGLWIMVGGMRSSALSTSASVNDLTQWGIASRLWVDAKIANAITVYADYQSTSINRWLRKVVNERGNFMVFSLSEATGNRTSYTKLTGYIYDPTQHTISRFDYTVSAADQTSFKPLEDILKDSRTAILAASRSVAQNVYPINTGTLSNIFLCRASGTAATLSCKVVTGVAGAAGYNTQQAKIIEATFFIRS